MGPQYPLVDQSWTVELADVKVLQVLLVQVVPGVRVGSQLQSIQVGPTYFDLLRQQRQLQSWSDIAFIE